MLRASAAAFPGVLSSPLVVTRFGSASFLTPMIGSPHAIASSTTSPSVSIVDAVAKSVDWL